MPAHAQFNNVLGIDTHKLTPVAVVLDGLGRLQGTLSFASTDAGATALLQWAATHGSPLTAGVEGTGSYGYQLARTLEAAGITVFEVNRPDRANRRRKGKSDPVDAEAAARAVLAGQATAVPKNREGAVESLRALTIARNSAVKATTTASNQIKAILVGADQSLRDAMATPRLLQLAQRTSALAPVDGQHLALMSSDQPGTALATAARRDPRTRCHDPRRRAANRTHPAGPTRDRDPHRRPAADDRGRQPRTPPQ